jgi:carbonic anhydrase
VPPELIFDRGLGEVFVIRVAGPVLNSDELASLEYALVKKHVKLVVVLGHTDCGAVRGAVDRESGAYLPALLAKLEPAIRYVSDKYNGGVRITSKQQKDLDRVSIANAKFVHSEILRKPALRLPGVRIDWGLYYLATGKVDFDPKDVEP